MRIGDAWTFDVDIAGFGEDPPSWNRISNANDSIRTARQVFVDMGKNRSAILNQTPGELMRALSGVFRTARAGYLMAQTPLTPPTPPLIPPTTGPVETPAYKEMRNRQVGALGRAAELMTAVSHAAHNLYGALDLAGKTQFEPVLKDMVSFPFSADALGQALRNMRKGTNHAEYSSSIERFSFPGEAALTFDRPIAGQLAAKNLLEPYTLRDEITRKLLESGELLTHEEIKATKDPFRPVGQRVMNAWAKHQKAGRVGPMPAEKRVEVGAPKRPALPAHMTELEILRTGARPRTAGMKGFGYLSGPEEEARYDAFIRKASAALPSVSTLARGAVYLVMADASITLEQLNRGELTPEAFKTALGILDDKLNEAVTKGSQGAGAPTDWTPILIGAGALVVAGAVVYFLTKKK